MLVEPGSVSSPFDGAFFIVENRSKWSDSDENVSTMRVSAARQYLRGEVVIESFFEEIDIGFVKCPG